MPQRIRPAISIVSCTTAGIVKMIPKTTKIEPVEHSNASADKLFNIKKPPYLRTSFNIYSLSISKIERKSCSAAFRHYVTLSQITSNDFLSTMALLDKFYNTPFV